MNKKLLYFGFKLVGYIIAGASLGAGVLMLVPHNYDPGFGWVLGAFLTIVFGMRTGWMLVDIIDELEEEEKEASEYN